MKWYYRKSLGPTTSFTPHRVPRWSVPTLFLTNFEQCSTKIKLSSYVEDWLYSNEKIVPQQKWNETLQLPFVALFTTLPQWQHTFFYEMFDLLWNRFGLRFKEVVKTLYFPKWSNFFEWLFKTKAQLIGFRRVPIRIHRIESY